MGKWLQGCAVMALVGSLGGQAFAQTQSVYVREVPVMAAPALATQDEFAGPPDTPLPPGVLPGTLDAQYVRWQAAHAAEVHQQDASADVAATASNGGMPVQVAEAAPPAAPPGQSQGPTFDIAPRLLDAASAFDDYMTAAAQVRPQFADGGQVAKVVDVGAGYEARQLQTGAIAYAALVALHDPQFVMQIRAMGGDPRALAEQILAAPQGVMGVPGADQTAARVAAALRERGAGVLDAGKAIKQSAYDVQRQAWSRSFVADPQAALARVKYNSTQVARADGARVQKLMLTVSAGQPGQPGAGMRSGVVTRGMALAALTVLGQAGEANADRLEILTSDMVAANCLRMSKLNFYQCMAVAGPQYEDLFCVGQHGLMDTASCMISAVDDTSGAPPAAIRTADAQGEMELTERQAIERGYSH
ncbi:MAG: hypothetical protein JSR86_17260 [Proteobacteria bacterium]|nr:hypothetical protein [Pseudomonadota bacterium]